MNQFERELIVRAAQRVRAQIRLRRIIVVSLIATAIGLAGANHVLRSAQKPPPWPVRVAR